MMEGVGKYPQWPIDAMKAPHKLNLGCGFMKFPGWVNVDALENCKPDVVWDLNKVPWPFDDNSFDGILANHVFEHLDEWWDALKECARILKVGGVLDIRVPDESSSSAGTYRDHKHIITFHSFFGIINGVVKLDRGTNAWAAAQERLPLQCINVCYSPYRPYWWMAKYAKWLLNFCASHLRNFIHEQRYLFQKIGD